MNKRINKADFVDQLRKKYGYTRASANHLVDDFWELIVENLTNGDSVFFYKYGTFSAVERKEREISSFSSDNRVVVPAHSVPKFTPGESLRSAVKICADNEARGLSK